VHRLQHCSIGRSFVKNHSSELNHELENFFAEIGVTPWLGPVAQRCADSNAYAEEILLFEF
jgi:hypothetical protein